MLAAASRLFTDESSTTCLDSSQQAAIELCCSRSTVGKCSEACSRLWGRERAEQFLGLALSGWNIAVENLISRARNKREPIAMDRTSPALNWQ